MVELTEEQIGMLNLSSEKINDLATANPLARKSTTNKIIRALEDKLREKAKASTNEKEEFEKIPDIISAARKYIKDQIKTGGRVARDTQAAFDTFLRPLTDMNLYVDGSKINESYLYNQRIEGKIQIRNPKPENMKDKQVIAAYEAEATPQAFKDNYDKIQQTLSDMMNVSEYKKVSDIPINKFLGAIDVSKATNRIEVYNYWAEIGNKYNKFADALTDFFVAVEKIDWEPEIKKDFDKLYRDVATVNLEYIAIFEDIPKNFESAHLRFFNLIAGRLATERLLSMEDEGVSYADDPIEYADVNSALAQELQSEVAASSSTQGDTIDPRQWEEMLDTQVTWDEIIEDILGNADPLLIYEYNKGEKLLGINDEMEAALLDVLQNVEEELDEGQGVTLDTRTNIEEWLEELEDTNILEEGDVQVMALPISVMMNKDFADMYGGKENKFTSVDEKEEISSDNLDIIKNFFNDLYLLLISEPFRMEVEARSTKGRRRGSVQEFREAAGTSMEGLTGGAKIPISMNQAGELRGELQPFKEELQKMMDLAIQYYFDPIYSGRLPIEIPNFASSIGSKVMQVLSLDLGLDTVMSASYDTLMEGSVEEVDSGDMRVIADFLENIFMPEINIDADIITQGEFAADALTEIFGREEANNDYAAALIFHFMVDTEDLSRAKNDFNGEPIFERAERFEEDFKNRRAFPIFALPHWLDQNQGVLTKKSSASKTQYNRLKAIFENAQTDLPVLLHKLLKAHDAVRKELGLKVVYGYVPLNEYGINKMITKMQVDENIDLSYLEVEQIVKAVDSHDNISKEYGISKEQVYLIKANFR